jgi:hypothetical protein
MMILRWRALAETFNDDEAVFLVQAAGGRSFATMRITGAKQVVVRDHNGQVLAHVYVEDESGSWAAAKLLMRDEARRIAANVAKLRELLRKD